MFSTIRLHPEDSVARLAIFQPDARSGARLAAALEGVHHLTACESWSDLRERLESRSFEAALIDADHPSHDEALGRIEELRKAFPELTLVGFTERTRASDYYRLGALGLEGFIAGSDRTLATRSTVDEALAIRRGRVVTRVLAAHLPHPVAQALGWALTHGGRHPTVEDMAEALGFSAFALRGFLRARQLPPPSALLTWGRVLAASARLHADGRKIEETAFALGYSSAPALRRTLRDRTGAPASLVAAEGLPLALTALLRALGAPVPAGHPFTDLIPVTDALPPGGAARTPSP